MHEEEHFFICIWQRTAIGENFDWPFFNGQKQWIVEQFMVLNERRHKSQFKLLSIAFNCAKNEWSYVYAAGCQQCEGKFIIQLFLCNIKNSGEGTDNDKNTLEWWKMMKKI